MDANYKKMADVDMEALIPVPDEWTFFSNPLIDSRRRALRIADCLEQIVNPVGVKLIRQSTISIPKIPSGIETTVDNSISNRLIEKAIVDSEFILKLPENWDEEGGSTYTRETWGRATQFIRKVSFSYKKETSVWVLPPKITPGPDGSIDVRWKTDKRSILINFPANPKSPADFYGSDKKLDTIKGTLDLKSQNHWLLYWLNK